MPKPFLVPEEAILEGEIVAALIAGLKQWRPDLDYPESHSDMQACVRNMLCMFKVVRRDSPGCLHEPCSGCEGLGKLILEATEGTSRSVTCPVCNGKRVKETR